MKMRIQPVLMTAMLLSIAALAEVRSSEKVLWVDFDMKNIAEPKDRASGYYDSFFKGQLVEGLKRDLDVPRWIRNASGHSKESINVNAVDEVPNSSWYTNRHRFHRMTPDELKRGPNGAPPDFSAVTVTKAKSEGVTPGLMVKDAKGQAYLVKFDSANYPNLHSGAEVIATKILYAAGYNVPENFIAYLKPDTLKIGADVQIADSKTGKMRALTKDDIDEMLRRVARSADGRTRVLASKVLTGKPKGPFAQIGFRSDDPNDLIPHEDRRELRGLRLISAWINNWDLKEQQSLDMYVEENGRKFLRHYLIDFGSSLGAGDFPEDCYHGPENGFDTGSIRKEIITLGIYRSANENGSCVVSSEIGAFRSDGFDPPHWKPTYPSIMFNNMTDLDAYWATRVILSFTDDDLRNIIETAEYADPKTAPYIFRTLKERRQKLAEYWLHKVDGLSSFSLTPLGNGVALQWKDLMIDNALARDSAATYTYQVKGPRYQSSKKTTQRPDIAIDRETLAAAVERGNSNGPVEITIWTHRHEFVSEPVHIYFAWSPTSDAVEIRRISRG